jgi:hypothetical protein
LGAQAVDAGKCNEKERDTQSHGGRNDDDTENGVSVAAKCQAETESDH